MGECDLLLVKTSNFDDQGNDMMVQVRTKLQYDYSYIESAALKIGDDVLEVNSYGDYAVNGVDAPALRGSKIGFLAGYKIEHTQPSVEKHNFVIMLSENENITLSSYKQLVSVSISKSHASSKRFGNSQGIMGSFEGQLLARDQETIMEDMNSFGQEWQVTDEEPMLFRTFRAPQFPERCVMPTPKAAEKRRLAERAITEEAAKKACEHFTGAAFEMCVYDVLAVQDLGVAQAGAY